MKKLLLSLAMAAMATSFASAQEASFDHPIGLRYLGTIKNPDVQPACSYLSRNPMNDGAFLWAPVGSKVIYQYLRLRGTELELDHIRRHTRRCDSQRRYN